MRTIWRLLSFSLFYCVANAKPFTHYGRCRSNHGQSAHCLPAEDCEYYQQNKHLVDFTRTERCDTISERLLICCPRMARSEKLREDLFAESSTVTPIIETRFATATDVLPQAPYCGLMLSDRIYGGNLTQLDEHPWMALLEYDTPAGRGFYCGGSLITDQWVLTAAHCITGRGLPSDWRVVGVRLGEWNIDFNPDCTRNSFGDEDCASAHIDVPVERQVAHPLFDSYQPNAPNDIALLHLQRPVQSTQFVKPICLPRAAAVRERSFAGATAEVSGWGRTQDNDRPSKVKLKAPLTVQEWGLCEREYQKHGIHLNANQTCAGGVMGVDACRGDSGGPLLLELSEGVHKAYYQIGVVSLGKIQCGGSTTPGVYTRVGPYIDWIADTISKT